MVAQLLSRGDPRGLDKITEGDRSPLSPMVLLHLSTAGVMLASNLTMGLYIHFIPSSQNGTIANRTLASSASPPAESINYITLIPLLATMFFIMGRCRGQEPRTTARSREPAWGIFLLQGRVIWGKGFGIGIRRLRKIGI